MPQDLLIKQESIKFYNAIMQNKSSEGSGKWFHAFPDDCCHAASRMLGIYLKNECGILGDIHVVHAEWYWQKPGGYKAGPLTHFWLLCGDTYIDLTYGQFNREREIIISKTHPMTENSGDVFNNRVDRLLFRWKIEYDIHSDHCFDHETEEIYRTILKTLKMKGKAYTSCGICVSS